jgi:hypothetical protein
MDRRAQTARKAWLALFKGVRAAHLYSADHGEVDRWVAEFVQLLGQAGARGPLHFVFKPGSVELAGVQLLDTSQDRSTLVDRMAADGVRAFHFHGSFDKVAGLRLLRVLAPYAYPERAPLQPLSDRLHWEAFEGLTVHIQADDDSAALGLDALTGRERLWREAVCDQAPPLDLPEVAMAPVWDGTRGRISWPPGRPRGLAELDVEVNDVLAHRASAARVGESLVAAIRAWHDDDRVDRLLRPLPQIVRLLLFRGRAGDAGRLLAPLLRWAGTERGRSWRMSLRDRVQALGGVLLDDDNLQRLAELVQDGRARADDLAAWFGALPVDDIEGILAFACTLPAGDCREVLIADVAETVGSRSVLLRPVFVSGRIAPGLAAFEVLERLTMSRETVGLVLEVLARGCSELVVRATGYLMPLRSRTIAGRLMPLLSSEVAEVRSGALTYMARYAYRPAFDALRDLTEGGLFGGLPLPQRLEICRTLGVVGGIEAEKLARSHLPAGWSRLDPDRSLPWVVCLAAVGSPAAPEFLEPATSSGPELHRSIARDAAQLWRRRVEVRGTPAPAVRTSPGAPIPVPLTDPGRSITGDLPAPERWSHRASLHSGQWTAPYDLTPMAEDDE